MHRASIHHMVSSLWKVNFVSICIAQPLVREVLLILSDFVQIVKQMGNFGPRKCQIM